MKIPLQARLATLAVALMISCQTAPPLESPPEVAPPLETAAATQGGDEEVTGTVRVTASKLNVRSGPSTSEGSIATIRRGERVGLIRSEKGWSRIRLADGTLGWVSTRYVRADRRCPPDQDFRFVTMPVPAFSEAPVHGTVVVEATVDTKGSVLSTRIVSNTTGDDQLGRSVENEIRSARFEAPVRNCVRRTFVYTYTRSF